jgi:hypothetical protein
MSGCVVRFLSERDWPGAWISIVVAAWNFYCVHTTSPTLVMHGCRGCHQGFSSCPNPTVDLDACLFVYMLTYDPLHTELSQPRQSPLNPSSNETHPCDSINQVFATQTDTIPNNSLPLSRLSESETLSPDGVLGRPTVITNPHWGAPPRQKLDRVGRSWIRKRAGLVVMVVT